jgi:hypothetical protein
MLHQLHIHRKKDINEVQNDFISGDTKHYSGKKINIGHMQSEVDNHGEIYSQEKHKSLSYVGKCGNRFLEPIPDTF